MMNQNMGDYLMPQPQMTNQFRLSQGINWVQGREGANAVQLPYNSNIVLIDSTQDLMYIKSTDNIGKPTLRVFRFNEITNQPEMDKYITREEFMQFINSIKENNNVALSANATKSSNNANKANDANNEGNSKSSKLFNADGSK